MAEESPQGGEQEEEVQDILSDLDNILQTLTESARVVESAKAAMPAAQEPPRPAQKPPPARPPAPAPVSPRPPAAAPVKPEAKPPAAAPVKAEAKPPAAAPVKAEAKPPAAVKPPPAMAPFGETAKVERPQPSLPPSVVERIIVDVHPKPPGGGPGAAVPGAEPPSSRGGGIELAPRSGMLPSAPRKDKPAVEPPKRGGLPTPNFVEMPMGGAGEPPKAEPKPSEAAPAPESAAPVELTLEPAKEAAPAPAAEPVAPAAFTVELEPASEPPKEEAAPAPAPVPVFDGPAAFTANPEPVPDKTPADQIRRIAFLYTTPQKEVCEKFAKFIGQVAKTFGKKPIYIHKAALAEVRADVDAKDLLEKLKGAGAVGVLALLEGLAPDKILALETTFEEEELFFQQVASADTAKRLAALDQVVEIMLLKAG